MIASHVSDRLGWIALAIGALTLAVSFFVALCRASAVADEISARDAARREAAESQRRRAVVGL